MSAKVAVTPEMAARINSILTRVEPYVHADSDMMKLRCAVCGRPLVRRYEWFEQKMAKNGFVTCSTKCTRTAKADQWIEYRPFKR